jgi:hypothetical protein
MLILAELWIFIEYIYKNGVSNVESTPQFKILSHIIHIHKNTKIAIPYWVLVSGEDDPKMIQESHIRHEPICNDDLCCYIFDDIYCAIYGSFYISKELSFLKPDDPYYQTQYEIFKYSMKLMEDQGDLNNLCDIFDLTKL